MCATPAKKSRCGRAYPHIYGPVNADAVTAVLPFLRDNNGEWRKNPELMR